MNVAAFLERSARRTPDAVAIIEDSGAQIRYAQLLGSAGRIATWLRGRIGLGRGDRVALVGRNRAEYVEVLYGAWSAGLIVVPVNCRLHPAEIVDILADSGVALCVCDAGMIASLQAGCKAADPDSPVRIVDWCSMSTAASGEAATEVCEVQADDVAWLFYTSGTTGRPKGVMLTHENLRQMVLNFCADVLSPSPDHTFVHFAPLSHGSGMYLLAFIAAGAANLITRTSLSSADVIPLLNRHRRLVTFMAPTMVRRLLEHPDLAALERDRLELIVYGGGPMLLAGIEEAVARLGSCFAQIYGQGESPMTITRLRRIDIERSALGQDLRALASVGQAFTGVEVRVVDDDLRSVPTDGLGEIAVRGPTVMLGYWRNDAATAQRIRDGWLLTGDLGSVDAHGYVSLKDRRGDVIISGGMNIYPREVEEVLALHPAVAEVAVVGAGDDEWGERVVAFVVTRASCVVTPHELDEYCRSRFARFKRPREYHYLEKLPRNAYGKYLKRELKARLAASDTRSAPAATAT